MLLFVQQPENRAIYPCQRYDLQDKSILKTQEKYYLADVASKYALLGYNRKLLAVPRRTSYFWS